MALSIPFITPARISRSIPVPFSMLVISFLALSALFMYGYSLRVAISYAVEREDIIESIASARASITSLDNAYVALTQGLSIERAQSLGFHEVTDPLYISLSSAPAVASRPSR